jgi:hypothetical protein
MNQRPDRQPDFEHHEAEVHRDPEDRFVGLSNLRALREKMLDKTLADSYPASDPPSSLPDPSAADSLLLDDEAA